MLMLCSCFGEPEKKVSDSAKITAPIRPDTTNSDIDTKYLVNKQDSTCMLIGGKNYCVLTDSILGKQPAFRGIYEVSNDTIIRNYAIIIGSHVLFTTYDDVGIGYRAYLFAFDINKKVLIKDVQFKQNYLYSSGGVFVIDRKLKNIFSIGKGEFYEKKQIWFTGASMYKIKGSSYQAIKNVYVEGEKNGSDTALIDFYNTSLINNAKNGIILPENWWRE